MSSPIKEQDAFFERMRKRFRVAEEALTEIHAEALEDFKFRQGQQWDVAVERKRKAEGRPCYTINRIPQFLRQVTNEQKKSRPALQISPVGEGSDIETAEIVQGLARFIERTSDADQAYDTAFDHMATGGFGFLRLLTDYEDDGEESHQEIKIQREPNPFAHFPDPRCRKLDYSDARYWFIVEPMDLEDFQEEYPDSTATGSGFSSMAERAPGWMQGGTVRVAEYFWIESKTIKGDKRDRTEKTVWWIKTNGIEILEGPDQLPGEWIPVIPVLGEELIVDGKRTLVGVTRYARQPQMLYNLWQSAMAESIAMAPKAPYLATPTQVEGYEEIWEDANNSNYPYLPYNPDPKAPGAPQRQVAEPAIQAINVAIQHADNDLKATTGMYDASLGKQGPEQSGKAILLRQKEGDMANFGFVDSMSRAIQHMGRIILSWIPTYYDAARIIHIVEPDGTSKTVPINQYHPEQDTGLLRIFDLTTGKYGVSVSTGPSHDSMRAEAADAILQMIGAQPSLMQVAGDLLMQCFDWPMAQELSERLKKMLPPQLQDGQGQAQIPPQAQAQMAQQGQLIQQMTSTIHQLSAKLEAQQVKAASDERIALIRARAGVMEAALKAKSAEAQMLFQADLDHIDRQLSLLPDPAMGQEAGAAQPSAPAPSPAPSPAPAAPMPQAA